MLQKPCKDHLKRTLQIHRVILGIFQCARITKHKQGAGSAKGALVFTEKQIASRIKEPRRVEEKAQQPQ